MAEKFERAETLSESSHKGSKIREIRSENGKEKIRAQVIVSYERPDLGWRMPAEIFKGEYNGEEIHVLGWPDTAPNQDGSHVKVSHHYGSGGFEAAVKNIERLILEKHEPIEVKSLADFNNTYNLGSDYSGKTVGSNVMLLGTYPGERKFFTSYLDPSDNKVKSTEDTSGVMDQCTDGKSWAIRRSDGSWYDVTEYELRKEINAKYDASKKL